LLAAPENHLGDSTIATLRNLVAQIDDHTTVLEDSDIDLIAHVNEPVQTAQHERDKEDEILVRMDKRLRAAKAGLKDASRGLKRVEREVEEVSSALEESEIKDRNHLTFADGHHHQCPTCGSCGHEDITLGGLIWKAWGNFLRNFYFWDHRGPWKWLPRLTWLGLICFLVMFWGVTEASLWSVHLFPPPCRTIH